MMQFNNENLIIKKRKEQIIIHTQSFGTSTKYTDKII